MYPLGTFQRGFPLVHVAWDWIMCLLLVLTCSRLLRRFPRCKAGEFGKDEGGRTPDSFHVAKCFSFAFRLYAMMIIKTVLL